MDKILRSKNFEQKLGHQVAEAEAIQNLRLPHPCFLLDWREGIKYVSSTTLRT